jgi:hypothetical protein
MVLIVKLTINQSPVMNGTHSRGVRRGWCGHHFNSCVRWGHEVEEADGGFNQPSVMEY